ncbi:MAG: hypothetical protein JWQ43_712 [Glaciihabitans sp.]|nr:hypothetical protein [Glaciihabitans sp.]
MMIVALLAGAAIAHAAPNRVPMAIAAAGLDSAGSFHRGRGGERTLRVTSPVQSGVAPA